MRPWPVSRNPSKDRKTPTPFLGLEIKSSNPREGDKALVVSEWPQILLPVTVVLRNLALEVLVARDHVKLPLDNVLGNVV